MRIFLILKQSQPPLRGKKRKLFQTVSKEYNKKFYSLAKEQPAVFKQWFILQVVLNSASTLSLTYTSPPPTHPHPLTLS